MHQHNASAYCEVPMHRALFWPPHVFPVPVGLQVSAESPELLVPLISSISNAWVWTVDQRRGLFSGQMHRAGTQEEVEAAAQQERQGYHDEQMLQVGDIWWSLCQFVISLQSITFGSIFIGFLFPYTTPQGFLRY
jgi:hypothetical protein